MKVKLTVVGLALLASACATTEQAPPAAPVVQAPAAEITSPADLPASGTVVSDWAPASEQDKDMVAARRVAMKQLYRLYPTSAHIGNIQSDIAAAHPGYYRFIMEMEGATPRDVYKAVVNRSDKGVFVVTKFEKVGS